MIEPRVLSVAVERGILSPDQVAALNALASELAAARAASTPSLTASAEPTPDDEKLRFISGFNDIFVGIGVCLFIGAVGLLVGEHADRIVTSIVIAVACWAVAELFTRRRRLALPSIQLLTIFTGATFLAFLWIIAALAGIEPPVEPGDDDWLPLVGLARETPGITIAASLLTCAAVALHYWRFRVPITIAAGVAALMLASLAAALMIAPDWGWAHLTGLLLAGGLAVFALAMYVDFGDLRRTTRRTDIAFWLHLLAAALIIHPIVTAVVGNVSLDDLAPDAALKILAVLALLSLVALAIDRRAILSAGLIYAGFAFYTLIAQADFSSGTVGLSVLALGAYVLAISALWRPLRNGLLRLLPHGVVRRLPQPVSSRAIVDQ